MNPTRLLLLLTSLTSPLHAADLMDVYHQALENDPIFKAAYSNFKAQSEQLPQAWSTLLPQLTFGALTGRNEQLIDSGLITVKQPYSQHQWRVNATQALF